MAKLIGDPTIPVTREKQITIYRGMSDRMKREFQDEITGYMVAGWRAVKLVRNHGRVELFLQKEDPWSFVELMDEIERLQKDIG